ncbi:MAG: hypothetical protein ACE5JR_12180 [Gemmatimonadota bacterium]
MNHPDVGARWGGLLVCTLVCVACSDAPPERAEPVDPTLRREQLRTQFASVQNQLRGIQAQALDSPGVRAAQSEFYEALRRRMIEIDSSSADLLGQATSVGRDLSEIAGSRTATREEKVRVAQELQTAERKLRPLQDSAFNDPIVTEKFRILQDSLVATITRIDPAAQRLLDQMRAIERRIMELDRVTSPADTPGAGGARATDGAGPADGSGPSSGSDPGAPGGASGDDELGGKHPDS